MIKFFIHQRFALVLPFGLIVLWLCNDYWRVVNPLFVPSFSSFGRALFSQMANEAAWRDATVTVLRAVTGVAIALFAGVPVGLLMGRLPTVRIICEPSMDFFRSIPTTALFFLFIVAFGIGDISRVALVIYGSIFIVILGAANGAKRNPEREARADMLRSFGASEFQVFSVAVIREAMPSILTTTRVAVSSSLVVVVVSEMLLSSNNGIGKRIYDEYTLYDIPNMYVSIFILGIIGYVLNRVVGLIEARISFWSKN